MQFARSHSLAFRCLRIKALSLLVVGFMAKPVLAAQVAVADSAPPSPAGQTPPAVSTNATAAGTTILLTNLDSSITTVLLGSPGSAGTDYAAAIPRLLDPQALAAMMASLDDRQRLGSGDKVIYRVIEDQDEPKSLTVTDSGDVDVPYFGLVAAMGKTCKQLASEVKDLLEKQYYYRATVIIGLDQINRKRTLGKVYVVGQVRVNGPQEIPDDETYTVSKAILKAGGFSDFADKKKVKLVRGKGTDASKRTIVVNVSDIWEKGKVENDVTLEPDDLIFVPARLVNF